MLPLIIFFSVILVLLISLIIYYAYNQIIWFKVSKFYTKADFENAIKEIDRLYSHATNSIKKKFNVYKASSALMLNDDNTFLDTIKLINKNSRTYGPYYYYYLLAYLLMHDEYNRAEEIYGILTNDLNTGREFDLVTPLAILLAHKGDSKAYKKLRDLKRNNHIDATFMNVANKFIRENKRND